MCTKQKTRGTEMVKSSLATSPSSAAATTTTANLLGGGGANKKKFGKNLNKLVKPAAPPITSHDRSTGSSRNGLLLLSTKSGKSANNANTAGGLLSKNNSVTSAASTTLGNSTLSGTSVSNLIAAKSSLVAAGNALHQSAAPDAWGVAQQQQQQQQQQQEAPFNHEMPSSEQVETSPLITHETNEPVAKEIQPETDRAVAPSWDEYGGRGGNSSNSSDRLVNVSTVDDQGEVMSRLARERAQTRRAEEEARLAEQRERAALRLRELDEKLPSQNQAHSLPNTPKRKQWGIEGTMTAPRNGSRQLWDPDQQTSKENHRGVTQSDHSSSSSPVIAPMLLQDNGSSYNQLAYNGPVIHLASYEDRDRGESKAATGPRMLYDPKSGSMVAVNAQRSEDAGPSNPRKKPNKKSINRAGKERDTRSSSEHSGNARDSPPDTGKLSRRQKQKSDGSLGVSERLNSAGDSSHYKNATTNTNSAASSLTKKKPINPTRRLPRTCGVLYARDDNGNCYCADECDGDLGYGAHSVPGGRTRNPEAFADFVKQQQVLRSREEKQSDDGAIGGLKNYDGYDNSYEEYNDHYGSEAGGNVTLYTGLNLDEELIHPEPVEYVRADDKLELVTGVDDSPTLKPTAKEWAPSQAALAAAAAAAAAAKSGQTEKVVDTSGDIDEDDVDDGPLGLGFDPTMDMDFVMQSPSHEDDHDDHLQSVAISALALEPPVFSTATATSNGPRHIFAFGSSGTWGMDQVSGTGGTDWKVPSSIVDTGSLFGVTDAFRSLESDLGETSFLGIPTSSSWGSPSPLGRVTTSGEGANTTTGD